MKSLKIALAVLAIVAMSSAAFAEFTITYAPVPNGNAFVDTYLVKSGGTAGFKHVGIYEDVASAPGATLANVVQCNEFGGYPKKAKQTMFTEMYPPDFELFDTHFMFPSPGVIVPDSTFVETNDKSNPAVLDPGDYGFELGKGTFQMVGGFSFVDNFPPGTDLMRVVLPAGAKAWLVGATPINGVDTQFRLLIQPVPEPGTIAMLIAAVLGLLVVRRVRK